jgi:hypothetical protein
VTQASIAVEKRQALDAWAAYFWALAVENLLADANKERYWR